MVRPGVPPRGAAARAARREHAVPGPFARSDRPGAGVGDPRRDSRRAVGEPENVQDDRRARGREYLFRGEILSPAHLLPVALLLASMLAGTAAAQVEDLPRIFFEKKVYSDSAGGKQSFFEAYTVEKGDSLWKILKRTGPLTPDRYAELLKEFRRANTKVADPSRLSPGQKLLVPSSGKPEVKDDGTTVAYTVMRGDSLSKILSSRDVPRRQRKKHLDAVREINPSVTYVNRIIAGKTLRLPTEGYFAQAKPTAEVEKTVPAAEPEKVAATPVSPEPAPSREPPLPAKGPGPEEIETPEAAIASVPPPA